jgi:hypothetical protein
MKQKWGAGHLAAWVRSGFKEIAQVLPAFRDSVHVVEEPGLAGNPTNIEVLRDKEGDYNKWLKERSSENSGRGHEPPEKGMEM